MKIYDISLPISPTIPTWPGDPPLEIVSDSAISSGDEANITRMELSVHTGTHIDAPKHFIDTGITVDQIPLTKLIGEALVIDIDQEVDVITDQVLRSHPAIGSLNDIKKVLFRTRNSLRWCDSPAVFHEDYVGIDSSGARYLERFHLDLIGIDYLSIAPFDETLLPHQVLLSAGIVLLEGLDLSEVPGGVYELVCLPLNIIGVEGAPTRAILFDHNQ